VTDGRAAGASVATRPSAGTETVLEARAIRKAFGAVLALDGVSFTLRRGEIHGLVGQNGAGKSTLVKVLSGVHQPDAGEIRLAGRAVVVHSPQEARRLGIAMVFQEFSLTPSLSVAENVVLGREPRRLGILVDDRAAREHSRAILESLGAAIKPDAPVGRLPVGAQQLVEIAKALAGSPSILILDEPTASLSQAEIETLFAALRRLRIQGVSMIYISHHLGEVMAICDRLTVLRDGRVQLAARPGDVDLTAVIEAMTGAPIGARSMGSGTDAARPATEVPLLELEGWTLDRRLSGVDLRVRAGEIVGVAGLLGSGRTSLLRSIMGLEPGVAGRLRVRGREIAITSPAAALRAGLAYVPEDRRREGIIPGQSVEANLLLAIWRRLARLGILRPATVSARATELIRRLEVRAAGPWQPIEFLSGGNQQKVVVGRSLAVEPLVLLLDDPTAGIDIGSRRELLGHIRRFADSGRGVVLVSSELDELAEIADRVAILRRGRISRILDRAAGDELSEAAILAAIHADEGLAA
jgi:ABC-type sugar transport system ATPase subunit